MRKIIVVCVCLMGSLASQCLIKTQAQQTMQAQPSALQAQPSASGISAIVQVDTRHLGARVSPTLHGIFFEEISHAGDGGLYAELIQNRGFEATNLPQATTLEDGFIVPPRTPHFSIYPPKATDWKMEWPFKSALPGWSSITSGGDSMSLSLTTFHPLNAATPHSLEVSVIQCTPAGKADLVNEGYWGISTVEGDRYDLTFYARNPAPFSYNGPLTASLQTPVGAVLASYTFTKIKAGDWQKYTCTFTASQSCANARFVLSFGSKGKLWLDFVSLFPEKTFKNRPNGLRADLANYIADLHPSFIRWPGGCYVEGIDVQSAPDWKRTLGPVEKRPGTFSPWGYWSTDGFGYQEYLQFCEDIGAAALYVFNVGVSCDFRSGTFIPDDSLEPVIQNALDAIEYALGPVTSHWGKVRAAGGHPSPYPLKYVEVGNEQHGPRYATRYNRFYAAIKKKYPGIRIVASMGIGDVNRNTLEHMDHVDLADEHAYKGVYWAMNHYDHFDQYKRGDWDMYVGEYATNGGVGRGNMAAALSDAVYIMSMERNSDLVKMSSYAPLLVNMNDESWPVNLINFNASRSFARISYYAIRLFNENKPDVNLATMVQALPSASPTSPFEGGIGLATWDTETEYKDIEISQQGQVVYTSDFLHNGEEWATPRGHWIVEDSALSQTSEGAQQLAWLKGSRFSNYTLTLKARKKDGTNAFIIPFAMQDSNTFLRAHIGSYVNSHCVFEKVSDGFDVSDLTDQQRLEKPIEKGRWYTIRLEVQQDKVECYLDGRLLMKYQQPPALFAIGGRDENTGDILIKLVNTASTPSIARIKTDAAKSATIANEATLLTLSAPAEKDENSLDNPTAFTPTETPIHEASNDFNITIKPYSINVLRLKDKTYKRP